MEKSKIELLFEQRANLLQALFEVANNIENIKVTLRKQEQRQESVLDELKNITQTINNFLAEAEKAQQEEKRDKGPVA